MAKRRILSIDQFRQEAKASEATPEDIAIRAGLSTSVKAVDGEDRSLEFTISTQSVDRMDDTVAVPGWKLDNYKKNPVVLWAHDPESLPVAKSKRVWVEGDTLKSIAEFTPLGMARFNDTVFDMYKGGFLNATSVGFLPIKWAWVADENSGRFGIDFIEQELLEYSCVSIPANPEALVSARSAGIDTEPMIEWAEKILDSGQIVAVPRDQMEALRKAAGAPALLAVKFRGLAKSEPKSAKAARSQLLRCANIAEAEAALLVKDAGDAAPEEPCEVCGGAECDGGEDCPGAPDKNASAAENAAVDIEIAAAARRREIEAFRLRAG